MTRSPFYNDNPNAIDYLVFLKQLFGEDYHCLPLWEIRTKDVRFILAWVAGVGHEVYWFDGDNDYSPGMVVYKRIHQIDKHEDALYWLLGELTWKSYNFDGNIQMVKRLGMQIGINKFEESKVVFHKNESEDIQ